MTTDDTTNISEATTSSMPANRGIFTFTGSALGYFKLWIVNLLMTIATVGLYSPWATVRNKQYLYNSTQFDNDSLAYLATPIQVLKGRAIALSLLLLYVLLTTVLPAVAGAFFLILLALGPVMIHLSMRFNMRNTSYRHVRFGYNGSIARAYLLFGVYPILSIFTLFLALPAVLKMQQAYLLSHVKWGNRQFSAQLSHKTFYGAFGIYFFGSIVLFTLASFMFVGLFPENSIVLAGDGTPTSSSVSNFVLGTVGRSLLLLLSYIAFFMIGFVTQGIIIRHIYSSVVMDDVTMKSELAPLTFAWIHITNIVLVLLTFGLAYPWAKVRLLKYKLTTLSTDDPTSLTNTIAEAQESPSAVAEEVSDAFDFDAGLSI